MSRYNNYAQELNNAVKDYITRYNEAAGAVKAAEKAYNKECEEYEDATRRGLFNDDYMGIRRSRFEVEKVKAQQKMNDAKAAFEIVRKDRFTALDAAARIRSRLEAAIAKDYAADPAKIDTNTITLLNSGILKAAEYRRLADQFADNPTMLRFIGDAAQKIKQDDLTAQEREILNNVVYDARHKNGGGFLNAYDQIVSAIRYTLGNPTMITGNAYNENAVLMQRWDELAQGAVDAF